MYSWTSKWNLGSSVAKLSKKHILKQLTQSLAIIQGAKKCRIFSEEEKKSNKHGSWNAYFLRYVHLFIAADYVWLWVRLRDRQGKHRGNKYCMVTVVAEGQKEVLLWTDVTLSTSYNKCHECTSGWTSPVNKCTDRRKYEFPDPCVFLIYYFSCTTSSHNIGQFYF